MKCRVLQAGLGIVAIVMLITPALAQSFGRAGGTGAGAGSGLGASAQGFAGSGGFGGSGFGAQTGSAFGSGGGGTGGSATGFATNAQSIFLVDPQSNTGFVGRDSQDTQQFFAGAQGGQDQFLNEVRRQQMQQQNRNNNRGQTASQSQLIRVTFRVAFDHPQPAPTVLSDALQSRVLRILNSRVENPTIQLAEQTVTLRGTVTSADEKLLAEKLLALEPGVRSVVNELQIVPESLEE